LIEFLLTHQALIREMINGTAFILCLTLALMITVFLWDTWVIKWPLTYHEWADVPGVPTACALWWIFASEAYRTANVWLTYNLGKIEASADLGRTIVGVGMFGGGTAASTVGYLLAGLVLNAALLRCIYIFTPPDWKRRVWLYAVVGALAFISSPTVYFKVVKPWLLT
jgi:hypothetical protein